MNPIVMINMLFAGYEILDSMGAVIFQVVY
jgi:hypothetical protein